MMMLLYYLFVILIIVFVLFNPNPNPDTDTNDIIISIIYIDGMVIFIIFAIYQIPAMYLLLSSDKIYIGIYRLNY